MKERVRLRVKLSLGHTGGITITDLVKPDQKNTICILLVDDQRFIVDTGKKILESLGYKVVGQTSSVDALSAFVAQPSKFDLVVTDLTMPKMTGVDLSQAIRKIRPDIPIILCTGYSEELHPQKAQRLGIKKMIMKPFTIKELTHVIEALLKEDLENSTTH